MARTHFQTVDEYIAALPEGARVALQRVRSVIRAALPDAEERISYQIPSFRLHGSQAIYFAGYAEHYSVYPASDGIVEAFGDELRPHLSGKATLRFSLADPVPDDLIRRIALFRARAAAERGKGKSAPRRKPSGEPRRA